MDPSSTPPILASYLSEGEKESDETSTWWYSQHLRRQLS